MALLPALRAGFFKKSVKGYCMYNKVFSTLVKFAISPLLMLGFSLSSMASSLPIVPAIVNHTAESSDPLKATLATTQKKQQFSFISKKLAQMKLPKELALIPVIESHYNTGAVSGKGAGGLWQLMPRTAKEYGISSKARFQLEPSTTAALHYFNMLHKKFGNWEFAIAAYNAGDGRVQKALSKNPTATSVQQLSLPQETKQYVQKFQHMQYHLASYSS